MNIRSAVRTKFDALDLISYLLIMVLPFTLIAVGDDWLFPLPTEVDPWLYSGLHLHLPDFLRAFGDTYYAARVPWTAPGWLLHSVFGDATALYILHFSVFYLGVFSLYLAVRIVFTNRIAAFATAILLGSNSYFLLAVGWDYVDGPSIVCMLAAFAAMACATIRPTWRLATFMWGVSICAMVSLYILLVLLVPVMIGMSLVLNRIRGKHPILSLAKYSAAGGGCALLIFGLINWTLGGPFLYFMGQIDSLTTVAADRNRWYLPLGEWIWSAPWLLLSAMILVFSFALIVLYYKSGFGKANKNIYESSSGVLLFVCCVGYISAAAIFVGLEAFHFGVLSYGYRSNSLLPFVFLIVGGIIAVIIDPPERLQTAFLAVIAAFVLTPVILATLGYLFPKPDLFEGPMHEIAWVTGGAFSLLLLMRWPFPAAGAALVVLLLSAVDSGAPSQPQTNLSNPALKFETLAVLDASRAVAPYDQDTRARFWFNKDDPDSTLLRDVASTYFYEYRLINEDFPSLVASDGNKAKILPGERIVLLTSTGNPVPTADTAVAKQNLIFEPVAAIPIRRPGVAFQMVVTDVKLQRSRYEEVPASRAFATALPGKIVTPSAPWAYAITLPLSGEVKERDNAGYIRVRMKLDKGRLGIGVWPADGTDWITMRYFPAPFGIHDIFLSVPKLSAAGSVVVFNGDTNQPSLGLLTDADVLYLRSQGARAK